MIECLFELRDVTLVLVELTRCKQAAGRNQHLMKLIHDGGFANTRVPGDEHQLRHAVSYDAVEGSEQNTDLTRTSVQLLGNPQLVWDVVCAKREFFNPATLPFGQATPKITLSAGGCLVSFLSSF